MERQPYLPEYTRSKEDEVRRRIRSRYGSELAYIRQDFSHQGGPRVVLSRLAMLKEQCVEKISTGKRITDIQHVDVLKVERVQVGGQTIELNESSAG